MQIFQTLGIAALLAMFLKEFFDRNRQYQKTLADELHDVLITISLMANNIDAVRALTEEIIENGPFDFSLNDYQLDLERLAKTDAIIMTKFENCGPEYNYFKLYYLEIQSFLWKAAARSSKLITTQFECEANKLQDKLSSIKLTVQKKLIDHEKEMRFSTKLKTFFCWR